MLENLKSIWDIIKGRVITDLNLIGVAVLLWIVAHQGASVLPFIALFPAAIQPVLGFVLPLVFGVVVQYAIIQTRQLSLPEFTEATHIAAVAEHDLLELLKAPNAQAAIRLALRDTDEIVKPLVIGAITAEAPILAPVAEAIIEKMEQAAGLANGDAKPAGEAHVPPIVSSPIVVEPAAASDAAA